MKEDSEGRDETQLRPRGHSEEPRPVAPGFNGARDELATNDWGAVGLKWRKTGVHEDNEHQQKVTENECKNNSIRCKINLKPRKINEIQKVFYEHR